MENENFEMFSKIFKGFLMIRPYLESRHGKWAKLLLINNTHYILGSWLNSIKIAFLDSSSQILSIHIHMLSGFFGGLKFAIVFGHDFITWTSD